MSKIQLILSSLEKRQLVIWAEKTIHGGHYGDLDVMIPEEGELLERLKDVKGSIDITQRDVHIMKMWAENSIGGSLRGQTIEERNLVKKILELEKQFQENV